MFSHIHKIFITFILVFGLISAATPTENIELIARKKQKISMQQVGIASGSQILTYDDAELEKYFTSMNKLGATSIRIDFSWPTIQPAKNTWHWDTYNRIMQKAQKYNISILGIIDYEPDWAKRYANGVLLPPSPKKFAKYAKTVAQKYKGAVFAWEIWNEPNLQNFWPSGPDPIAYGKLAKKTAKNIRKVDPTATILVGSMAPAQDVAGEQMHPVKFLRGVYKTVPKRLFDAVAMHPYTYPYSPYEKEEWNSFYRLEQLHALMKKKNDSSTKIWLTEYGAPTGNGEGAVDENAQAQLLKEGLNAAQQYSFVGPVYIYSLRDTGVDISDREQNFGLLRHNWTEKTAFATVQAYLQRNSKRKG